MIKYIYKVTFFILLSLYSFAGTLNFKNTDFSIIDKHADETSPQLKKSIPALVNYLVKPAQNDTEKVRAIFRWITQNIDYDIDAYFDERLRIEDPKRVINSGNAVCGGYAVLFKTMCANAGIKSEIVTGWSKGYGETITTQPNHAWNVVTINNKYYLLDVTWGSGYINEQVKYKKSFNEHYFLTEPDFFIYDHYPENELWQLSSKPISRLDFKNLILLRPAFFKTGLGLISHKSGQIDLKEELLIKIQAPSNTYISAQLIQDKKDLSDNFIFIQKQNDVYEVIVHFPDNGIYTLRVFSKFGNDIKKSYSWACDYIIEVQQNINNNPFTKQYAMFEALNGYIYHPTGFILKNGKKQEFKIRVDETLEVVILQDEKLEPLKKSGNDYSGTVLLNADTVRILARTDTSGYYHYLLEYIAQ